MRQCDAGTESPLRFHAHRLVQGTPVMRQLFLFLLVAACTYTTEPRSGTLVVVLDKASCSSAVYPMRYLIDGQPVATGNLAPGDSSPPIRTPGGLHQVSASTMVLGTTVTWDAAPLFFNEHRPAIYLLLCTTF